MDTLYQLAKERQNSKLFISYTNEKISYTDFFNLCQKAKKCLEPLSPGDILISHSDLSIKLLPLLIACLDKKAHFLPLYEYSNPWERAHVRKYIQPHWEFTNERGLSPLYPESAKLHFPPGVIFQTSGSSGSPRFVYQSQEGLIENARRAQEYQNMNTNSKALVPLTLSHTGGLNMQTLPIFMAQGELYWINGRDRSQFQKFFDKKLTHALLVPYHLHSVMHSPQWRETDFSWKMTVLTGSCPIPNEFYKTAKNQNLRLIGVYGLTEIGPFVSVVDGNPQENKDNLFPIGQGLPDFEFKLSPKTEEILIKGPCMGKYIHRENQGVWVATDCGNPWVCSGDKGKKQDNFLYYQGRINREINFGGFKVNPEEVEEILKQHPKVKDCLVYGKNDSRWNEIPSIKIISEEASIKELKKFLKTHLTSLKVPRYWEFVNQLEYTSIGKIKPK